MRQDFFIVWPHGLSYVDEILKTIDTNTKFKIVSSKRYTFTKDKFVEFLYLLYSDQIQTHIMKKNKYIFKYLEKYNIINPEIEVITFINYRPWDVIYDDVLKCQNVESMKICLRDIYNPHYSNLSKQVPPYRPGVSHHHILHSSSNEYDIYHLQKCLDRYFTN